MRLVLFIIFLFSGVCAFAQQPSHFVIGAQELAGIDVYNLIQDDDDNYWIATDNGLYVYDGHSFEQINCAEMRDNSLFNFVKDKDGRIYCNNLNGQIFYVEDKQCRVYATLPDSLISPEIFLALLEDEHLVISCNDIVMCVGTNEFRSLDVDDEIETSGLKIDRVTDGRVLSFDWVGGRLIELTVDGMEMTKINFDTIYYLYFVEIDDIIYGFDVRANVACKLIEGKLTPIDFDIQRRNSNELMRMHSVGGEIWGLSNSTGALVYDEHLKPKYNGEYVFSDQYISATYCDSEGNILHGTFGGGIIVIPNKHVVDVQYPLGNSKVTRIERGPESSLLLGTLDGRVVQVLSDDSVNSIVDNQIKDVNMLRYLDDVNQILSNEPNLVAYSFDSGKSSFVAYVSVKDVERIFEEAYLITSNVSVHLYLPNNGDLPEEFKGRTRQDGQFYYLDSVMGRTYCANYDSTTETIYVGRASGLRLSKGRENFWDIMLGNEVVLANDIIAFDGKMYVGTNLHGVLIFENDSIVGQWNTGTGLASNTVQQMQVHDGIMYLATSDGFQLLNTNGEVQLLLNRSDGLLSNNVADFVVQNGYLWLVVQNQIQRIPMADLTAPTFTPTARIEALVVNDSLLDYRTSASFNSKQRKFLFKIGGPSLKFKDEIIYEYRLVGLDDSWQQNAYEENTVEYKSLPTGEFEFQLRAICRGKASETISYPFRIYAPFWQTWWFIVLVVVCFIAVTIIIYRIQIRRQKRLAQQMNELNASKLTAIQSQMNPHFIFNALNSIQDLVLKQDTENSYSYIVKFASLVRRTLNYSDKDLIEFESELKLIDLYLSLEKLRFKEEFDYTFETGEVDNILVPPMLIQPFIENSLHHGLLHKEGKKEISIRFEIEDVLICTITDNGVGRARSREIKERQNKSHESFSGNAIKKRFEILKQNYGGDLGFKYIDLYDGEEAIGTKVQLRIPMQKRF